MKPHERALRIAGFVLLGLLMAGVGVWGVLALLYFEPLAPVLRTTFAAVFAVAALTALIALAMPRWRWPAALAYLGLFILVLACWEGITASNERNWRPEVAVLPYATFLGAQVTVHNIRNFDYRTDTDFTPAYYDATFDLAQLSSADLIAVYWMGPQIAHGIMSFGFSDGRHLAFSIEARNELGEGYSTLRGFFRQYELFYVVADERDVIRLRTNFRHDPTEDAYLFRLVGTPEALRHGFMNYMHKINSLKVHPEFYNTLTTNCFTGIWQAASGNPGQVPFSWKILLSGHAPEYLYEEGKLDRSVPFEELRARGHINARARAAGDAPDFSQRIRDEPIVINATPTP